jgi:hypothetical protein
MSPRIGQTLEIDVSGLRIGSQWLSGSDARGTVVAVDEGVITLRLDLDGRGAREITVSPGRVLRLLA